MPETYTKKDVYQFIIDEEASWKTNRVPITGSKDWNMHEHIERCTNVANGWFHQGNNDGLRPYNDIVTPIVNVAFRLEGFDVKDIIPFVDDADQYYKSFLIKKYHPQWARKNEIDTFIDDLVETSVIYDLALVKNVNDVRPEVVSLQSVAFCDQTDVLAGPICLKHQYSIAELQEFKGKWDSDKIDEAITMAQASKTVANANDAQVKTPGKYITVYELHGMFEEDWLGGDYSGSEAYCNQLHIVTYYTSKEGKRNGICLFKAKEPKSIFKALKIDRIKSFGRACGKSIVETLFEPQVWNNYDAIKIKELLDAAITVFQTDSDEYGNQKLSSLKANTVLKHEQGRPITKLDGQVQNLPAFQSHQLKTENDARVLGSASEAALGKNPVSGTPFALQQLIVQEGQGIHEYRQGKIATFVADELYRDWILDYLVKEMNGGKTFSEELTFDELKQVAEAVAKSQAEHLLKEMVLRGGDIQPETRAELTQSIKEQVMKGGARTFMEVLAGELTKIPISVYVNIKGKQRNMVENADKLTNIIREVIANPAAFQQIPGIGKAFNELLEESGLSPIDFNQITAASALAVPAAVIPQPVAQPA
jgi:hypothetical protein